MPFKRKEVYGTSGPRFIVRFFVGDNLDKNLCNNPDNIVLMHTQAAPMGGTIASDSLSQASHFYFRKC